MPASQPVKCIGVSQVLSAGPQLTNVVWNTGDTTNSITVKAPGTYWFTAKYPHMVVVLDTTVVTNVTANAIGLGGVVNRYGISLPVMNPSTVALCAGNTATLNNLSTGTNYLWSNGATTSSLTVNAAGTHYSMVKRAHGCWDTTATVTIAMNAAPDTSLVVSGPLAFCPGGSVTVSAAQGLNYLWSTGSLGQSITLSQTSAPFAIVSTNNGCIDTTRTLSVTRFAAPWILRQPLRLPDLLHQTRLSRSQARWHSALEALCRFLRPRVLTTRGVLVTLPKTSQLTKRVLRIRWLPRLTAVATLRPPLPRRCLREQTRR